MQFHSTRASVLIPDGCDEAAALGRITHLGIGAHADDLEFMALHGILACHDRSDRWFGGVTCTDGRGSARSPQLSSDDALVRQRHHEQEEAALIGRYGVMIQLGYSSQEARNAGDPRLTDDLVDILRRSRPEVVYTHNPADKHATHVAVTMRVVAAARALPAEQRPKRLLGCEVWRGLDWMMDGDKVRLDVSRNPALAERLAGVFVSQMDGGKRYDLAVRGRERANATFHDSHQSDDAQAVWLAMDLTPLLDDGTLAVSALVERHLTRFHDDVMESIKRYE